MERDFLGLSSNNVSKMVKEEANGNDDSIKSAVLRGSGMQWSFSNKISAVPQFLSFRDPQEDRPRKIVHDPVASSGFMTVSTADVFESSQKPYSGKNLIVDKQMGNHYAMKVYPVQHHDAHSVHRPQEMRIFPVSNQQNQTSTVALGTTVLQSHLAPTGQNMVGSTIKPQPFRVAAPVSFLPSTGSIVGSTDLRSPSKSSGAPAQLTIFYAGSVNVYNDITPEKAQAIMSLAAKGSSPTHHNTLSTAQVPSPCNGLIKNQSQIITLLPGLSNPLTSQACSQSGVGTSSSNELVTVKPTGASPFSINHSEPPKAVNLAESAATTLIPTVALPQARKASLARFLEKRKERVMLTSPYNVSQKSLDSSTPRSDGSCPLTATN
ncbi:protein TIFY 6B isoform X3 [Corylus avellana]|uniref:protein TIFY 6B isoform X3 n=1 Tax=Corylus avellana TaxID=13451 RepID=UPI001E2196C6|nr:protein TIFY 6B isoform X3 [Corylus avellana]